VHRAAIGIFDSGIGGLTVASAVARELPNEDVIYLGDTARLPYGTKSAVTVSRYAARAMELLLGHSVKAVVVACNTASAHAIPALRAATDLPVIGVVEPGARAACASTRSGKIGVAGTEATIRSGAYQAAIEAQSPGAEVVTVAWPLLVPLAEEGWTDHPVTRLTLQTYLAPFVEGGVDTIVLGCTHYPVFKETIRSVLEEDFGGAEIALVDSADVLVGDLACLLADRDLRAPDRAGRHTFFCTDAPERFARVGGTFFSGGDLGTVTVLDL
jgi:glutamate racemase